MQRVANNNGGKTRFSDIDFSIKLLSGYEDLSAFPAINIGHLATKG